MKTDIELIDNSEHLNLIQEACEDSYRSWSDFTGSVISASKKGTIDRRTFEEISRDVFIDETQSSARKQQAENETSGNTNCFRPSLLHIVYLTRGQFYNTSVTMSSIANYM